jgi:hypothetical protein
MKITHIIYSSKPNIVTNTIKINNIAKIDLTNNYDNKSTFTQLKEGEI